MVNKWLKIIQKNVASWLPLASYCVLCLHPSERRIVLCHHCEQQLPWLKSACLRCAMPVGSEKICGPCLLDPPFYEHLHALCDYAWPMNAFIGKLKYGKNQHFAKLLGQLMAERLTATYPVDCVVTVPLHPKRQQQRGFNQTLELAKVLAADLQYPVMRWSCSRTMDTVFQSSLRAKARRANITFKAFAVSSQLKGKHVLVIEDVVTTGATINAFAQALKKAGATTVEIWSCCRTL